MCKYIVVEAHDNLRTVIRDFDAEGPARDEAAHRAEAVPGTVFEVFQFVGCAQMQPKVVWKGAKP